MNGDASVSDLAFDLPSPPQTLVQLAELMAEDSLRIDALGALVASDMALAAALLKTVNGAWFGLGGRVQSVHQAITFLGVAEVAALTQQVALQAAFPAAEELLPLWQRAAVRARLMAGLGRALGAAPWVCHAAGLFEESGKAVLFRHAATEYRALLARAADGSALALAERARFGASHDAVGAALCETWGLAPAAVSSVRHHLQFQDGQRLSGPATHWPVAVTSVLAQLLLQHSPGLDDSCVALGQQVGWDPVAMARMARQVAAELL